MKVLLALPRFEPNTNPPLGLGYLASVLRRNHVDVEILDPTFEGVAYAIERLKRFDYDILGISAYTMNFNLALEMARQVKAKKEIPVVFGGVHPTILYPEVIPMKEIDFVVVGEGEGTLPELVDALDHQRPLEKVDGLVFKRDGKVIVNPPRGLMESLDSLPFPARDLLPMKKYLNANFGRSAWAVRQPSTTILTTRGCPFHCTYCSSHLMFGRRTRYRSAKNIVDEIEGLIDEYRIKGLSILDDTFIMSKKQIRELAEEMKRRRIKIEFICNGRVDIMDREILKVLKEMGCVGIAFGVESGSQSILDHVLKKGITLKQVQNAFQWAFDIGIPTDAYFMVGIPGETEGDILETIRFSKTLKASAANFAITIPMPKTELHELALKHGEITAKSWDEFDYTGQPIYRSNRIDASTLIRLRRKAIFSFYFRVAFLLDQLFSIRSPYDLKRKLKGFLMLLKVVFRA